MKEINIKIELNPINYLKVTSDAWGILNYEIVDAFNNRQNERGGLEKSLSFKEFYCTAPKQVKECKTIDELTNRVINSLIETNEDVIFKIIYAKRR